MTFRARGLYASSSKERGGFRRGPWMFLGGVLVLALVVVTALSVLGNMTVNQSDRADSFDGVNALEIDNSTLGGVVLRGGGDGGITVDRKLRGSPLSEPDEDIETSGDTLEIDADCSGLGLFDTCSVDYDVTVPAGTSVELRTVSGLVSVENLEGELRVETSSGAVDVTEQVGAVEVESVSGDLVLDGVEGAVEAHTVSGRITASGAGSVLDVSTTSGEVVAEGFGAEEVRAESVSGSMEFGGGFTTLEASTTSGGIRIRTTEAFELLSVETVSGEVVATVPDGVYEVEGDSVSGQRDIDVTTGSGADGTIDVSTTSGSVRVSS
ncbi:DUF4097 family beta strand repeat-containing protein [Nocardiopsis sp. NPDC007018]|uniref:DUF4097 family beta strand repeat-containing protein n=1 Tax=Nocardiopsis sp. NPDC007018 TaxID=3155721 RepID=UPI0033CB58C0